MIRALWRWLFGLCPRCGRRLRVAQHRSADGFGMHRFWVCDDCGWRS